MAKYSFEFKKNVVLEYINGEGGTQYLSTKYGLGSNSQESFQTGKAIVTVSVDLITAIADACKRSEQQNPGMSEEQKETLLGKVVDKVMSNYKETHGSLKGFNREGTCA